jgi:hypothetical protein
VLSQAQNTSVTKLNCPLGGEHGKDCIPLFSLVAEALQHEVNQTRVKQAVRESGSIGVEIVKDLGYTLQDCAVVFSHDIQWIIGQRNDTFRSFSRWHHNACIGWPLRKSTSGELEGCAVSEAELKALSEAEEHIYQIFCEASREWFTTFIE